MVLILTDLMLRSSESGSSYSNIFKYIDLGFLMFFTLELCVRLYAYGTSFLFSFLNTFDALIVVISLILQIYWISDPSGLGAKPGFLSALRMVRLLRLFVVLNKVQNTRSAYKKTQILKAGPPVERVMQMLNELKDHAETDDMATDIEWIVSLIASDKLYSMDLHVAGKVDDEMRNYLKGMGIKKGESFMLPSSVIADADTTFDDYLDQQDNLFVREGGATELQLVNEVSRLPTSIPFLERIHSWHLDPFEFHKATHNAGLVVGGFKLLQEYGLIDKFRLSQNRLLIYLREIQDGYRKSNPYHNCIHALDVMLNTNYFIRCEAVANLMTPLDMLACLLAAAIHDHEHPGVNNNFLALTKHDLAITYNDQSILENHHVASAWALLLKDDYNFLQSLTREQYLELRDTVIQLVIGTDMKFHFDHVTKLKTKMGSDTFQPGCERADVKFLLTVLVHAADIANPAKRSEICFRWTELVMEEFFRQGDVEKALHLPVSPFYDRVTTSSAKCQMGFINVIVKPLYTEFCAFLGDAATSDCMDCLLANLQAWEENGDEILKCREPQSMTPAADGWEHHKKPPRLHSLFVKYRERGYSSGMLQVDPA